MRTLLASIACLFVAAAPLAAQDVPREWPSRAIDIDDEGEDPPMGKGGRCRIGGERVAQGDSACVDFGDGARPAVCGMSLNVTSWLPQDGSCAP